MEKVERKKKYRLKGKVITVILCVLCLGIGLGVGVRISRPTTNVDVETNDLVNEIINILDDKWVDVTDSEENMQDRMVDGLVNNLGDAYTNYMSIDELNDFVSSINGSFVGIGVSFIAIDDGGLVLDVYKDTPAYNAGIKAGDVLIESNGASLTGLNSTEIKEKVVGEENSQVRIKVLRDNKELIFNMVRKSVEIDVEYEVYDSFGYLNIITFGDSTADHVETALKAFKNKDVKNIVIDVRDNSGGYLTAVQGILNLLVPDDQVIYKMQDKDGTVYETTADNKSVYEFDKGFILMNGESASASEVMIGALTEVLDYKTIGAQSFGKGIAQTTVTLSNGSSLKYTNAKWLTPSEKCIHNEGFMPDYEVEEDIISNYVYSEFKDEYQYDDVNNNIAVMQKMLKRLGYDVDRVDGYFSAKTKEALMEFQEDNGIKEDGILTYTLTKKLYGKVAVEIYQNSEDKVLNKVIELLK